MRTNGPFGWSVSNLAKEHVAEGVPCQRQTNWGRSEQNERFVRSCTNLKALLEGVDARYTDLRQSSRYL